MNIMLKPKHIFLDHNITCNLKCGHCQMHTLENPVNGISIEEKKEVIKQIAGWSKDTRLVITGGEPFLKKTELFDLLKTCKENNIYTTASTNGTTLWEEDFKYLPTSGLNCIVVSIDSHIAELHNKIRGVKGTFEKAVKTIQRLVIEREKAKVNFTVLTSTILGSHNLNEINDTVAFIEDLGVDTMLFQPIQPTFANNESFSQSWYKESVLFPAEAKQIDNGIDSLILLKTKGRKLFQEIYQFENMRTYFKKPISLSKGICQSMKENMMIDIVGNIRFCFNMERMGLPPIGNIRKDTLKDIWETKNDVKEKMKDCALGCATMICHSS